MQKREFEEMVGKTVSDAEYELIEAVYQWHPSVRETSGKEEVAELYKSFGITIFLDMFPRAEKNRALDTKFRYVQTEMERIREEIKELPYQQMLTNVCEIMKKSRPDQGKRLNPLNTLTE